jgi:solute carrier family 10 (sodium/bile acid cotransporter), member 7
MVLACLPPTINMCISQTQASGGNMLTAIFNAVLGNFIGVFLTPILVIVLMGVGQGVSLIGTLKKLVRFSGLHLVQ